MGIKKLVSNARNLKWVFGLKFEQLLTAQSPFSGSKRDREKESPHVVPAVAFKLCLEKELVQSSARVN